MTDRPAHPRAWQRMLSGRRLDLLNPVADDIAVEDIAHGLARVARWNGQTEGPNSFSVAQHSILVESIAAQLEPGLSAAERLAVLLHDGPEYVVGDLISPFKVVLGDGYKAIENRILDAIHMRFGLPVSRPPLIDLIKRADRVAAFNEAVQLAGFAMREALLTFGQPPDIEASFDLVPWPPEQAATAFLERVSALQSARDRGHSAESQA